VKDGRGQPEVTPIDGHYSVVCTAGQIIEMVISDTTQHKNVN